MPGEELAFILGALALGQKKESVPKKKFILRQQELISKSAVQILRPNYKAGQAKLKELAQYLDFGKAGDLLNEGSGGTQLFAMPGDCEIRIYDRERKNEKRLFLTNHVRDGWHKVNDYTFPDVEYGLSSAKPYIVINSLGGLFYKKRIWAGTNRRWVWPSGIRKNIVYIDITDRSKVTSRYPWAGLLPYVDQFTKDGYKYIVGIMDRNGPSFEFFHYAMKERVEWWDDIIKPGLYVIGKNIVAIVGGFITAGPVGAVIGCVSAGIGTYKSAKSGEIENISNQQLKDLGKEVIRTVSQVQAQEIIDIGMEVLNEIRNTPIYERVTNVIANTQNIYERMQIVTGMTIDVNLDKINIDLRDRKEPWRLRKIKLYQ